MISPEKKKQIREFMDSLDRQEQIWTNGLLEGLLNGTSSMESVQRMASSENKKITSKIDD